MKSSSMNTLVLAAAVAGLMGGTSMRLNAQPASGNAAAATASAVANPGTPATTKPLPKHACKGLNACKGQGGGANPGKNSCKGKGGCATDGSK